VEQSQWIEKSRPRAKKKDGLSLVMKRMGDGEKGGGARTLKRVREMRKDRRRKPVESVKTEDMAQGQASPARETSSWGSGIADGSYQSNCGLEH